MPSGQLPDLDAFRFADDLPQIAAAPTPPGLPRELIEGLPHETFRDLTQLAAQLFAAPVATVMLSDGRDMWTRSPIGMARMRFPVEDSYCIVAMRGGPGTVMVVNDAPRDARVCASPFAQGEDALRFYAGAPMTLASGAVVGALCVLSPEARGTPSDAELDRLKALARMAVIELELRDATRAAEQRASLLDMAEELAGVGHWRLDVGTGQVTWSREVYRIHGVTPETYNPNQASAVSFYVDEDERIVRQLLDRAVRERTGFDFELRLRRADGEIRHVTSRAVCELSAEGAVSALFGVFQDVTDRKTQVEALQQSEARYRLLADKASDIICRISLEGEQLFVSPSIHAVLGYGPAMLQGRSLLDIVHPEDRVRVRDAFARMRRDWTPHAGGPIEYRARHADGGWLWLESRPTLRMDVETGAPVEFIDVIRDVTPRKAQERALTRAREEAEAASRSKSEFLANMSHELRTPLNSIIGFTDVLRAEAGLSDDQRRRLRIVEEAGRSLLCVVNDVLDLSAIEAGRLDLSPRPFDLEGLVRDAEALMAQQAAAKGLQLHVRTPGEPRLVVGDHDRIRQVLLNLLSNAVKFTDAGRIDVDLAAVEAGSDLEIALAVRDTGIGIAPDHLRNLFERFSQADGSIARRYGGSGLGLAISRRIAEAMGGRLDVESAPGRGSTFTLRLSLPFSAVAANPAARTTAVGGRPLEGRRILVAEDVEVNRELVKLMLEPAGCVLDFAMTGAEAVQRVATGDYDAIFMDLQMPDMDGLEATRRIRSTGGRGAVTPIIALTANVLSEQVARCKAAGMDDHVGKPFSTEELLDAAIRWAAPRRAPLDEARAQGLSAQIGEAAFARLMTVFDRQLAQFEAAAREGRALSGEAHALKGVAGSLGFLDLAEAARRLEMESGDDAPDRAVALLDACASARSLIADRYPAPARAAV